MKNLSLLWLLLCLNNLQSFSQEEIPVDMYTGTPTIQVPLWTASHHDISFPVALSYNANGIRAGEPNGNCGLGWSLIAGGSITRQLKGLPDDFTGTDSDLRRGWLYTRDGGNGVASEVGAFGNTADLDAGTCSDELTDNTTLNTWNDLVDTEPDIFSFSFPGYSGAFVFDNGAVPAIHLMPYQDMDVSYTTVSATDKHITSFTVKTNNGYRYIFGLSAGATKAAVKDRDIDEVTFLTREFNQYDTSRYDTVAYTYEWKLTKIESPSGAYADLYYSTMGDPISSARGAKLGIYLRNFVQHVGDEPEPSAETRPPTMIVVPYVITESTTRYWLDSIKGSSGQKMEFIKRAEMLEKVVIKDQRRQGDEFVKEFRLRYHNTCCSSPDQFLVSVTEQSGCEKKPPYVFEYLKDAGPFSATDLWGYYNGKVNHYRYSTGSHSPLDPDLLPRIYVYPDEPFDERFRFYPIPNYTGTKFVMGGVDRFPDEHAMKAKTLNRVIYPSGGGVVLQYEAHRYYDQRAAQSQMAGGLRIKSITQFDGMNNTGRITKEFFYTDPATGQSSGKLISRPQFVLPAWKYRDPVAINDATRDQYYGTLASTQTTENLYKFLTIRSETDLSDDASTRGSAVGYRFVTVKRSGAGSARFEFLVPGTYGETANGEWTATQNKFVRPAGCASMGLTNEGGAWRFPFSTNPVIDHERGLMLKKSEFNENGTIVRYTENTYQYLFKTGNQSQKVWGVQYDRYPNSEDNIYFYGTYFLPTDYAKVLSKEAVTTYDTLDSNKKVSQSVEYFYESAFHKLLSRIKTTTGDGAEYTREIRYAKDFGTIPANAESALLRIKDLQDPDAFRHGQPIEQWTKIKLPGGTEKVTGASLVTFSDFSTPGKVLPDTTFSLHVAEPVSNFSPASVVLQNGVYKLVTDGRYEMVSATISYDAFDLPATQTGTNRIMGSTIWGYDNTVPIATASNAGKDQLAFSDLETDTDNSFQLTNGYYASAHTGARGVHPYAKLSKTIVKGNENEYVLSFWVKATQPLGYRVKILMGGTTYFNTVFTHTPSSADFEQVRKIIPLLPALTSFVIEISGESVAQPSGSSATLLPSIDDVAFMPASAEITSYTYHFPYGVTSTTTTEGRAGYTEFDALGRQTYVYDQYGNIRSRNTYTYSGLSPVLDPDISAEGLESDMGGLWLWRGEQVTFNASVSSCFSNVTYEWDIDLQDQAEGFVAGTSLLTHTYTEAGEYTAVVRVSAPGMTPQTHTITFNVRNRPVTVSICAAGAREYSCGQETYHSNNCPSNPSPPAQGTVFTASIEETISGISYTWKRRFFDTETWETVGTNANQYSIAGLNPNARGFEIKCEVNNGDGRTGESNKLRIDVYPCE